MQNAACSAELTTCDNQSINQSIDPMPVIPICQSRMVTKKNKIP